MTSIKDDLCRSVYQTIDPFLAFTPNPSDVDMQGWGHHPFLKEAIDAQSPQVIIEVGVWKGSSVIHMAQHLKKCRLDSCIIAVDTWLGSVEHWINDERRADLRRENGRPNMQSTFMTNCCAASVSEYVLPLPIDSINASILHKHYGIFANILHIDAGHDYDSVKADLQNWWPILKPGGIMLCDDYCPIADNPEFWPGVRKAVEEHALANDIEIRYEGGNKAWMSKR